MNRYEHLQLAKVLADVEQCQIIPFNSITFNGGENHIRIKQCKQFSPVIIETAMRGSRDIMELLLATDALRRTGVEHIELLCPYIPYARQDRVMSHGEPLSIKVFADLINSQNYKKVYTLDNHSPVSTALINNCVEISLYRPLTDALSSHNSYLVSPDAGAYKKVCGLSTMFNMPVVCGSKQRNVATGRITGTKIDFDDLEGRDCYVVDDICDGGKTFVELAKVLKAHNSGKLHLFVTHSIFSSGLKELMEHYERIATVNCWCDKSYTNSYNVDIIPLIKGDLKCYQFNQ